MDVKEFREFGHAAIEFLIEYWETLRDRPVLASVEPGYLKDLLPTEMPESSEKWQDVLEDVKKIIVPGLTHWQSPNFHAFFPSPTSFPAIIGEILSSGFGIIGFNWMSSPVATELEVIVIDWLGKFLNLPSDFLPSSEGKGGGIIQGSASESIIMAILAAREEKVREIKITRPDLSEGEIRSKLIAYTSKYSNCCTERATMIAATKVRLLNADDSSILRGETVQKAIEDDIANDLIPYACIATVGTTGTLAIDDLEGIGPICNKYGLWMHVDGAYALAAFCLPEYSHIRKGIEFADSINFNLHKWMLVYFECTAMWVKDSEKLTQSLNVDRLYLSHKYQGSSKAPDYRHWQLALGRRFRSLRVWITFRTYGKENIRNYLRSHISLAALFLNHVSKDERFEEARQSFGLVYFRLKGDDDLTKDLVERINSRKHIYMNLASYHGKVVIRFCICGIDPEEKDVHYGWNEIKTVTDEMFEEKKGEKLQ